MKVYLVYRRGVVESVHATKASAQDHARPTDSIVSRQLYGVTPELLDIIQDNIVSNILNEN